MCCKKSWSQEIQVNSNSQDIKHLLDGHESEYFPCISIESTWELCCKYQNLPHFTDEETGLGRLSGLSKVVEP